MSTMTGLPGHEVKNPKRRIYKVQCRICGAINRSIAMRCKGCDCFLVQPKPTGTDEQQKQYLKEYLENKEQIDKQNKRSRPKLTTSRHKYAKPSE